MEAAEVLRCSYMELEGHPQKRELMRKAFSYRWGKNAGETQKEANPLYQQAVKKLSDQIQKARKRKGGANTTQIKFNEDSDAESDGGGEGSA